MDDPKSLSEISGIIPEEVAAYKFALEQKQLRDKVEHEKSTEERFNEALEHVESALTSYRDIGDRRFVTYTVNGRNCTAVLDKDLLWIHSAGICLPGENAKLDITSLISVLRQGRKYGKINIPDIPQDDCSEDEW